MEDFAGQTLYSCRNCRNPIALRDDLLSKHFMAKSGPACMFTHAMNVVLGRKEERGMLTGWFTIADVSCHNCGEVLRWKYVRAHQAKENRYKEGKFVLETMKIVKEYY
ncbi:protein yippee-like At4g27740 [Malania oleifera]|uniref:protein yippee-like At4g27740 n=1 Tax=Malania oleifera TaxID=397392 RepID=UPI0025ADB806|nr:protein yippee-like At4g27740 [Malania oleifera]